MPIALSQGAPPRVVGHDRSTALERERAVEEVATQRRAGETAIASRPQEPARPESAPPVSESAAPRTETASPEPAAAEPDPKWQVEIERRERALDAQKHQFELMKREYEQMRKSPEDALRALGFTPESYMERWLGSGEGTPGALQKQPEQDSGLSSVEKRLRQIEEERDQLKAAERARSRRAEIEALIPDSEEYDAIHGLRDAGAVDQLMAMLDQKERGREGGLGPHEVKALIGEFEGNSRKNVQAQIKRLAERKWFRKMVGDLLQAPLENTSAPAAAVSPRETFEAASLAPGGAHVLRSQSAAAIRERIKAEWLSKRGV
jgi:hypothetical protein